MQQPQVDAYNPASAGANAAAPDPPPGEAEADKAHQAHLLKQEEEKAKKPAVMFYDPNTGKMSTKDPNAASDGEESEEETGPWVELKPDKGKAYFYNIETKERSWEKPVTEKKPKPGSKKESEGSQDDAEEEDETGPQWHQFKTEDGFFFWNSDSEPPATTWGPPPRRIVETKDETARLESLQWVWTKVKPPFKPADTFAKDGKAYYYNPFSKEAQLSQPGKMVFKAVPAWDERVSKTDQPYYFDRRCVPLFPR